MSDRSLYSSLFRYVPTESRSPLEDFLTEAIADLLNRLLEKKGAVRKKTESFISKVLCNGSGGRDLEVSLRSAKILKVRTQKQISFDNKPKRLDLCLLGDNELLLVVENKVVETRGRRADLTVEESVGSAVAAQLKSYARWLQQNHPGAGLVLLGINQGPSRFSTNKKEFPASFRSVCHWTRVWEYLLQLARDKHLDSELSVLVTEFTRFMEEKNLSDLTGEDFKLLQDCLPYVHPFLSEIQGNIVNILKETRTFSEGQLPGYRKDHRPRKLPSSEVRGDDVHAIGDFAYCYDLGITKLKQMPLKWFVGWGFQVSKSKYGALQAFVCVESDYDGTLIPPPPGKEMTALVGKGWQFAPPIVDENGECSAFEKVFDAASFLPGFTNASLDWFKKGIREAAEILEAAKKRLQK